MAENKPDKNIPTLEDDALHFFDKHKIVFSSGMNSGEYLDKEDFEKFAASLNRQGWTRDELKIYFENNFDCYGDAQGDVVLAMTFEAFEKSFQHWMPLPNKPSI